MRRVAVVALAALVALGVAGCGAGDPGSGTGAAAASARDGSTPSGDLTVLAAASLTEAFTTLGTQFEAAHPGVEVTFSFASSSALATQITSGAPADVFASASPATMAAVVAAGAADDPAVFAENVMEIAVPPTNPGEVTGVESLASSAVKTALCQPQVPCGATAQKVFTDAGVVVQPVTLEPDVKSVLSKVQLGEVDAGVVYVTDVRAAGDKVKGIEIAADVNASTTYPIVVLEESRNPTAAAAFVDYVLSADGAAVLSAAGFQKP